MKIFTSLLTGVTKVRQLYFIVPALTLFTSVSCAVSPSDTLNKNSQKYLSFYETVDGETIHWEVNFDGSEITSVYKNGIRIPDDLVADYEEKVYDQLDEMRFGKRHFSFRIPFPPGNELGFDPEDLERNLDELKEKLKNHKWDFEEFYFDDEKLKREMEELHKKLKKHKFHQFRWKFDDEKFRERMEKFEENLKKYLEDLELKFDFDSDDDTNEEV